MARRAAGEDELTEDVPGAIQAAAGAQSAGLLPHSQPDQQLLRPGTPSLRCHPAIMDVWATSYALWLVLV